MKTRPNPTARAARFLDRHGYDCAWDERHGLWIVTTPDGNTHHLMNNALRKLSDAVRFVATYR